MWFARRTLNKTLQMTLSGSLRVLLLLQWMPSEVPGAEMCTKSVPVGTTSMKKVSVLRRVPASCSNWEKAWSWITKRNCGTMYRLDMVEVPSSKRVTYRVVKVCCEGDIQCQQRQEDDVTTEGDDMAEEKVLSIVLGSCAAVLVIIALIVTISLCRRKKGCRLTCEERKHVYVSSVEEDESSELQTHNGYRPQAQQRERNKVCESEYAEIHELGLPRYADIFREEGNPDASLQPTAPPLCLYESRAEVCPTNHKRSEDVTDGSDVIEVVGDVTDLLQQKNGMMCGRSARSKSTRNITEGHTVHERRHNAENRVYHNHPVLSQTDDDRTVLAEAPSLPATSVPHPQSTNGGCCDDRSDVGESSPPCTCRDKTGGVHYETLCPEGSTDCHGYQRLTSSAGKDTEQASDSETAPRQHEACDLDHDVNVHDGRMGVP